MKRRAPLTEVDSREPRLRSAAAQAVNTVEESERARDEATAAMREAEENEPGRAYRGGDRPGESSCGKLDHLPVREQFERIQRLERDLQVAEAALGGGISVMVRPAAAVTLVARVDQEEREIGEIAAPRQLEAERTMHLSIADLVEIDILAGNAEKRQAVEQLRRRWEDEAVPSLRAAGADTVATLQGLRDDVSAEQARIEQKRRERAGKDESGSIVTGGAAGREGGDGATAEELERRSSIARTISRPSRCTTPGLAIRRGEGRSSP